MSTLHEDGVFFGMPDAEYFADPALGSTDLKRLLTGGPTYWWNSSLNPNRVPREDEEATKAPHLRFGSAVHKFVLEGEAAFRQRYAPIPTGPDVLVTDADLSEWLLRRGHNKVPRSKAEKVSLALYTDPNVRILDDIKEQAAKAGITLLPADEAQLIFDAVKLIKSSPALESAFAGGQPEVSVFWTDFTSVPAVRKKARFDYLKVRGIGDLKSIGNTGGQPFPKACAAQIAGLNYDLQAAHYMEGRRQLPGLYLDGKVSGEHDTDWLSRVAGNPHCGWYFVFFHNGVPPQVWATALSPGSFALEIGAAKAARAVETYRQFMLDFGPDNPWVVPATLEELTPEDMPGWYGRT